MGPSFLQKGTLLAFVRKSSAHRDRLAGSSGGEAQTHEPRSRALRIPRLLWLHPFIIAGGIGTANVPPSGEKARAAVAARCQSREGVEPREGPLPSGFVDGCGRSALRARAPPPYSGPRGASARRAFRRAERGASAWAVENRARAWPRVVCVCMCQCLCLRRVVCTTFRVGSLFYRPRSTQRPAASASERRSTVGCDKNRPLDRLGTGKVAFARP